MSSDLDDLISGLKEKVTIREEGLQTDSSVSFFEAEIRATGFSIFKPLSDLGYFKWSPSGPHRRLGTIKFAKDICKFIDMDGIPDPLVQLNSIRTPVVFHDLVPNEVHSKFPFGQITIASLHVARERGLSWENVDFCFGGASLDILANRESSQSESEFYVTKLPQTEVLVLVKDKSYIKNSSDFGFQFERLVTGKSMQATDDHSSIEHLHTMKVGDHCVLFQAEVDAIFKGEAVEVTASNPRYWGITKVMQMMSNGSPRLCHGIKQFGMVVRIQLRSLSQLVTESNMDCRFVENRILSGMAEIKSQMNYAKGGDVYKASFLGKSIHLSLQSKTGVELLPSNDVVSELIN